MEYNTTKIKQVKSYPTYRFHAFTASDGADTESVFRICILETLRWIRKRLNNFNSCPPELQAPDPENYSELDESQLCSFNINAGAAIDCTYIREMGVWSFRITEPDAGENLGTPTERLPVVGRFFRTDVAFMKHDDCVEAGIMIVCSEPADCDVPCSVFRPAIVKALANNPLVGFENEGFRINGKAVTALNQTEFRFLERLTDSGTFDMPIVLVAERGYDTPEPEKPAIPDISDMFGSGFSGIRGYLGSGAIELNSAEHRFLGIPKLSFTDEVRSSIDKFPAGCTIAASGLPGAVQKSSASDNKEPEKQPEKLPEIDIAALSAKLIGFAAVFFVSENCFDLVKNKLGVQLSHGNILICSHGKVIERYRCTDENLESITDRVRSDVQDAAEQLPYSFGSLLFYSDARLEELKERHSKNLSLEEELKIYRQENSELKSKLSELGQRNTEMELNSENTRILQKQLKEANGVIDDLRIYIENVNKQSVEKENSYRKAAELMDFYRRKVKDASYFPTDKDEICGWAAKNFSENIFILPRAESALKKYNGELDTAILCDGIYYLNAYADYRRGRISEEMLLLYAGSYNWDAVSSGKGAMKRRKTSYTAVFEGRTYQLDMHIKYGVSAQSLIRVYFCWDDEEQKVVIGYMPDHLATVSQST